MKELQFHKTTLLCACTLLLAACQTTDSTGSTAKERAAKIDSAMQRAALNANRSGQTGKSLAVLEKIYKRNTDSEEAALNYAAALRRNNYLNRASTVLEPFVTSKDASTYAKSEFAAIMLARGEYKIAEGYAKQAVELDDKNPLAYHYLGVALDTQGEYESAERAFRKGLELWQGDPTSIMNNLALNLAAQEELDEAAEILQSARELSPNRREIERNLRIITALQQTRVIDIPKPGRKPERS